MTGLVGKWMQQSATTGSGINFIWNLLQLFWTFRRVISIIAMAMTVMYLLFGELLEQRRFMLQEFATAHQRVVEAEAKLKIAGDAVFRGPSRDGRSITYEGAEALYKSVQTLRSLLAGLTAPTYDIETATKSYLERLTTLQGKLNLFEEGKDGTTSVLEALEELEGPSAEFHSQAEGYQTSTWRTLLSAF